MQTIGIRELRRDASRWLARVRAGEVFVITDRGTPIAKLGPITEMSGYAALVSGGRLLPGPGRSLDEILADVEAESSVSQEGLLSEALAEMRAGER